MIGVFLLLFLFAILIALVFNPKLGAILVWPIVYLYPHLYWYRLAWLPWNIGVDDLFICVFFALVVIRRNLMGGMRLRIGLSVVGVFAYFLIWMVANLSGWAILPELAPVNVLKPILKCLIFVLFTYAMVHSIDNERDLRRVAVAFVLTLAVAGLTVILHQMFPQQMVIFTSRKVERFQQWYGQAPRAVGSLMNPNTACVILGMAVVFAVRLSRLGTSLSSKLGLIGCIIIMLIAMVLSESRTGALALGLVLLGMVVLSRARLYAGAMMVATVVVIAISPVFFRELFERFAAAIGTAGDSQFGGGVQTRLTTWFRYWETATVQTVVLGQGQLVPTLRIGFHAHSSYLSALFVHGMAGVVWFVTFFGLIAWRGLLVVRTRFEPYATLASAMLWGMLLWAIAGLTLDLLVAFNTRYVFLFYAVMIERSHALLRQQTPLGNDAWVQPVHGGMAGRVGAT